MFEARRAVLYVTPTKFKYLLMASCPPVFVGGYLLRLHYAYKLALFMALLGHVSLATNYSAAGRRLPGWSKLRQTKVGHE